MDVPITKVPKRILMTADTVGGVWTYALELVRSLTPMGIQVVLATMGSRLKSGQIHEASSIANLEIVESSFKLEWMNDPWSDVAMSGEWLLALEACYQPDIIHLNGYSHGALPWSAPVIVVGHSCVLSWWQAVKGENAPKSCNSYRKFVTRGIQAADLVIAPSQAMLNSLYQHYGPLLNTMVIHNGRDKSIFKPAVKESFILAAGRLWDEAKNIKLLAKVAPHLSWPVCLAGETEHPHGEGFASPNARLLGLLGMQELAPWFSKAAIYALPARYEPFGLSALEAALSGCALVLGDIPSLREIWDDAAVYVSPDDPVALQEALRELISNPLRLKQLAAKAHARAQRFSPEIMAELYLHAYSSLIAKQPTKTKELLACES